MRNIYFIIMISFVFTSVLFTQIKDEYKNAKLLKGNYTQIVTQKGRSFESSGDFIIVNGYGICWFTKTPQESITVMGEKNVVQIMPDGKKKVMADSNNAMFAQIANIIKSIFTYDEKSINESFNQSMNGNIAVYSPKTSEIKKIIEKIEVTFSSAGYIEKIKMYSSNNSTTEYIMEVLSKSDKITSEEIKYFE
ncbi:cell envelope biogenesis protein LolA [Brachyspira hampsonii]|uniref:Cell envelope biogenesis protein LolA n=1 Tax=Brachyspira hampsonii TaxID=1287055 RepID=A0A1E5NBT1_9SPIR|nr:outer-membrane lipoprotein carrier protein LolA [Brachyspira hampsonii]OEJ13605.1 cell envelope biogenesis protein LolA [Brachyspira hampsonii]